MDINRTCQAGQVAEPYKYSEQQKNNREDQVRHLHRISAAFGANKELKYKVSAYQRTYGCSERVESLCKVKPAGSRLFGAEYCHIGIGCYLQERKAKCHYKECRQKETIHFIIGCRNEKGASK